MVDQLLSAFGNRMIINSYRHGVSDPLLDGLVAWWSMDETSGTRFDSHTNGLDLTDVNTVGSAAGKINNAADFTFANNEELTNNSSLLKFGADDFSFSFWLAHSDNVGGTSQMVYNTLTADGGHRLYVTRTTGVLNMQLADGLGAFPVLQSTDTLVDGVFSHVVITHKASTKTRAIIINDGTPATAIYTETADTDLSAPFRIGSSGANYYDGLIDEVPVWNRVITASEITRLFNSNNAIGYPGP